MNNYLKLFLGGYTLILCVSINTWQIANQKWLGAIVVQMILSMVWSGNVKNIVVGTIPQRLIYAVGTTLGCVSGIFITKILY